MKKYLGEIGLCIVAIIWGSGFVGAKLALDGGLTPVQTLTIRYLMGSVILGVIFFRKIKANINMQSFKAGAILGVFSFIGFATQTIGLDYTTASKNAFITAINVVIVPFIGFILYRRKLDKMGVGSSILALVGIAVLSLEPDLSVNFGDFLTFLCAFGFALHIFFTGEFSEKYNPYVLTVSQFAMAFVLSLCLQIVTGQGHIDATPMGYAGVFYLGLFSTAIGFLLQTKCQSMVDQTRTAIILSTEAVFGATLSILILGEILTARMVIGCIIIFVSIIISETKLSFLKRKKYEDELVKIEGE
ncbi:MAG: DMT family transporter [Terrisporobacter sp.]|uniref:DMT family transporter n=1 Tax=Terrisporobacter sp. TaxID=1965305 RepID=UPI002FC6988B